MGPITVYHDNMSPIALVQNGKSNRVRTRHTGIVLGFLFISDKVASKEINVEFLSIDIWKVHYLENSERG